MQSQQFSDTDILNWLSSRDDFNFFKTEGGIGVIENMQTEQEVRLPDSQNLRDHCIARMTAEGWTRAV